MIIAIPSEGQTLKSKIDTRFGRCAYFVIVDTENIDSFKTINNEASASSGGAGVKASQLLIDEGVKAVISISVGPNAHKVLEKGKISIYKGVSGTVKENIEKFIANELEILTEISSRGRH